MKAKGEWFKQFHEKIMYKGLCEKYNRKIVIN